MKARPEKFLPHQIKFNECLAQPGVVVFKSGSDYIAYDWENRSEVSNSTNPATVINAAFDAAARRSVYIKEVSAGITLTSALTLNGSTDDYMVVYGDGWKRTGSPDTGTWFITTSDINMLEITNNMHVWLRGLAFYRTSGTTKHGIYCYPSSAAEHVCNASMYALRLEGSTKYPNGMYFANIHIYGDYATDSSENNTAILLKSAIYNEFHQVFFENITKGIVGDGSSGNETKQNHFYGGYAQAADTAFELDADSDWNSFKEFHLYTTQGVTPIAINDLGNNNKFHDMYGGSGYTGTDTYQTTTKFVGRIKDKWATNHGSSTGTGAEQTIAHSLIRTPTIVLLSPPTAQPYQSSAADGTNIYVTADNTETWYWWATASPHW